jgi:guanylate kinase
MGKRGLLFVISGPSGAGKGTTREALMRGDPGLAFCVSVTTRRPRAGEIPGVNYTFVDVADFRKSEAQGEFLESAQVYGNLYGTPRAPVEHLIESGQDVLLEKDVQGALAIQRRMPHAILVFIAPPSVDELKARILKRGTESAEDLECRLDCALREMDETRHFDYVVVNYDIDRSTQVLEAIVIAERHRVRHSNPAQECLEGKSGT